MRSVGSLLLAVGFVILTVRPAGATMVALSACNVASLCNQMQVAATLRGSVIDVSLETAGNFGVFGSTGASRAFAFNVAAPLNGVTLSNISTGFRFGGTNMNVGGGFGTFEYIINGPKQGSNATANLDFTVARTGGFTSAAQLFEANSSGYFFAAHVRNNGTGVTGFAGGQTIQIVPPTPVPEPASLLLLGTGVAGLVARSRRRRRLAAAATN